MRKIGYIVTDRKMKGIDPSVIQVNNLSEVSDPSLPILIVGWKNASKHNNYKSIIEKQLGDKVFWTFSKTENRSIFESDLLIYYNYIYNNILNNINYYYINIFKLKYNSIKKLYKIIFSKELKNIYIKKDLIYIPYKDNNILGISLKILKYCKMNPKKIISRIKSNSSNNIITDDDFTVNKISKKLGNKAYAVPYFV